MFFPPSSPSLFAHVSFHASVQQFFFFFLLLLFFFFSCAHVWVWWLWVGCDWCARVQERETRSSRVGEDATDDNGRRESRLRGGGAFQGDERDCARARVCVCGMATCVRVLLLRRRKAFEGEGGL